MENIIQFKNVKKVYNDNIILDNFNLDIHKGEFLSIIGSSGSGKTTVLKMINALVEPDVGDVIVNGKNNKDVNKISLRRNIGYAVQGSILFPHMDVYKNISYVLDLNKEDKKKIKETVYKWMEIVSLDKSLIHRYPNELSGGEAQRVSIARSLASGAEILLMDEPFSAVDEITRRKLQDEILSIYEKTGITIVFITHDINEALKLSSRILVMNKGRIEQIGTKEAIINSPSSDFVKRLVNNNEK